MDNPNLFSWCPTLDTKKETDDASDCVIGTNMVGSDTGGMIELDFHCRVCGKECDTAPMPPDRAVCPEHCEDHEYYYERGEQRHLCKHCGQDRPYDWGED